MSGIAAANRTYPKLASDLLPGHIVAGSGGQRYRVTHSRRLAKGVREIGLMDTNTGLVVLRTMPGANLVQVVDTGVTV